MRAASFGWSWLERSDPALDGPIFTNTDETRSERYQLYFAQLRCTMQRVGDLLAALGDSQVDAQTVVIIHGDHGSRIAKARVTSVGREHLSTADVVDYFSTLAAIRSPGVAESYRAESRSLNAVFNAVVKELALIDALPTVPEGVMTRDEPTGPMIEIPPPRLARERADQAIVSPSVSP